MRTTVSGYIDREVGTRPIGVGRIILGVAAVLKAWQIRDILEPLLEPDALHIPYFTFLPSPSPAVANTLLVVWALAAILFTLGLRTRMAGAVLTTAIAGCFLLDQQVYSNHLYLLLLVAVLFTVADSGSAFALDARRRDNRPVLPAWQAGLLKFQLTAVYGFATLAKLNGDYLTGEVLRVYLRHLGPFSFPDAWKEPGVLVPLAVVSILTEAFLAAGFWWRRTRTLAAVTGVVFHAVIIATMSSRLALTVFGLTMAALYTAFYTSPVNPTAAESAGSREPRAAPHRDR